MPKSNCFRTPFASEREHESQTLLKYYWQHFYRNFPIIQNKLDSKTCLWMIPKILGLFVNTLTGDNMYSPIIQRNSSNDFKRNYLKNEK